MHKDHNDREANAREAGRFGQARTGTQCKALTRLIPVRRQPTGGFCVLHRAALVRVNLGPIATHTRSMP